MSCLMSTRGIRGVLLASLCTSVLLVVTATEPVFAEEKTSDTSSDGKGEEKKDVRMPFLTAALDGGMIFFSGMSITAKDDDDVERTRNISSRLGAIVKLQINLLGDGLGLEINPFFASEWVGDTGLDRFSAVGAQLGLAYRFHIRRFYPKIGIGAHLAYIGGGDIGGGMEAFGRLPFGFSIYFARFLAFEMEAALMTGATGIKTDGFGGGFDKVAHFDYNTGVEVVIGLRFP